MLATTPQARPRKAFLALTGLPRPDRPTGDAKAPLLPAAVLVDDSLPAPPSPKAPQSPASVLESDPYDVPSLRRLGSLLR